ncbi:MAG: DUF547 domain-containing protein [Acidobacteriota bacterium]|nr:DUF547 domain-containing protein [Acidobacteriota bacterium]
MQKHGSQDAPTGRSAGILTNWALPPPNPGPWDALLKDFVNQQHRVAYSRLKRDGLERLKAYLAHLAQPAKRSLPPGEKKALLINAYNAFTVDWIVGNYPTASIWETPSPFTVARFTLGGRKVSLDQIEAALRSMGDPRIHGALVCAGRSCPPLRREAYVANRLNQQLDDNVREWLADKSLNRFYPKQGKAEISSIFKWDARDFGTFPGGLLGFLRKYAPPGAVPEAGNRKVTISYLPYNWGLNDQSSLGKNYSPLDAAIAWLKNWL